MEHEMPDFLVDFFAERNYRESTVVSANTPRKEWKPRPVSWRKIPFQLSTGQKETFSTLESLLQAKMSSSDLVLLTPSLPPCCPKCSSQCIGLPRKALCFLKKRMLHCEVLCYTCVEEACDGTVEFDGLELTLLNMGPLFPMRS